MTVVEEGVVIPETQQEEPNVVHIICCVTYGSKTMHVLKTICGVPIDDMTEPVPGVDQDCERCEILNNTGYCPLFKRCIELDDEE